MDTVDKSCCVRGYFPLLLVVFQDVVVGSANIPTSLRKERLLRLAPFHTAFPCGCQGQGFELACRVVVVVAVVVPATRG